MNHTTAHPHGHFFTNKQQSLEFLRISKCGSSSFANNLNLTTWLKFNKTKGNAIKLACLRDPYSRFISSIPETLKRLNSKKEHNDDVVVDEKVILMLRSCSMSNADEVLHAFTSTIEALGYFDAHHEPQTHFFLNPDGSIGFDAKCFPLDQMNRVLKILGSSVEKHNDRSNALSRIQSDSLRDILKTKLGLVGLYKRDRHFLPLDKNSLQYHFVTKYNAEFRIHQNQRAQMIHSLAVLYRELKKIQSSTSYIEFIQRYYSKDIELFEKIKGTKEIKELSTLPNFSHLY